MTGLPSQYYLISNALRATEQSHRVVSQNIANVNTPGYQSRKLSFEEFQKRITAGLADQEMMPELPIELTQGLVARADGNNVDIDKQLADLKKNSLLHQTYTHLLASKMSTARRAITG